MAKKTRQKPDLRAELKEIRGLDEAMNGAPSDHPLSTENFRYGVAKDLIMLDPNEITLEGPYVRHVSEHSEVFQRFVSAIRKNKDIGQPIAVRTVGPMHEQRFILVWGMRRWKAARLAGLSRIPARNFGPISEAQAVALQMMENELREEPHVAQRAYGYYLITQMSPGATQIEIAEAFGIHQSYLSVLARMGEAIALLEPEDRERLLVEEISVQLFQSIVRGKVSAQVRKERLLAALAQIEAAKQGVAPAEATKAPDKGKDMFAAVRERRKRVDLPFQHQNHRDGRTWRMRILDQHLREDPESIVQGLGTEIRTELGILKDRLHGIAEGEKGVIAKRARRALEDLEQLIAAVGRHEGEPTASGSSR